YLRERGIRDRTELVYATPLDGAFTKPIASEHLAGLLAEKEIELVTEFNAAEVDGIGGKLSSYDSRELEFDLLVTIPLHGGAAYVERSPGLGDALGFVPTDKRTLQTPGKPNVFALGDATRRQEAHPCPRLIEEDEMTMTLIADAPVDIDAEGFLTNPEQWNEQTAHAIAAENGIADLTERHWLVVRFMRERYLTTGTAP